METQQLNLQKRILEEGDKVENILSLNIEEISIGMSTSHTQIITESDTQQFARISGDYNPVHLDEEYASKSRFKKRIAHGMLSASFFSGLFGTKIPGEGCVYISQSLRFLRPVYLGDEVVAYVEVKNVDKKRKRVKFKTVCRVNNKKVIDGEAEIFIP